jgi:hypothetical protein
MPERRGRSEPAYAVADKSGDLDGPGPCVFGFVQRRHPRAGQPDVCQVRSASASKFC